MTYRENFSAVHHRLNFLHREYLQHTRTSLPKGTINLLGLYNAGHFKQVIQSYVIHTDRRPNPKTFIVISGKKAKLWLALLARKKQSRCPDYFGMKMSCSSKAWAGSTSSLPGSTGQARCRGSRGEPGLHQQLQIPVQINIDADEYRTWVYYLRVFEMMIILIAVFYFYNIKTFLLIYFVLLCILKTVLCLDDKTLSLSPSVFMLCDVNSNQDWGNSINVVFFQFSLKLLTF